MNLKFLEPRSCSSLVLCSEGHPSSFLALWQGFWHAQALRAAAGGAMEGRAMRRAECAAGPEGTLHRAGTDPSGWCHTWLVGDKQDRAAAPALEGRRPVLARLPCPCSRNAAHGGMGDFQRPRCVLSVMCAGPGPGQAGRTPRRRRDGAVLLSDPPGWLLVARRPPCPQPFQALKLPIKTARTFSYTSLHETSLQYVYSFAFSVWKILSSSLSLSPLPPSRGCRAIKLENAGF